MKNTFLYLFVLLFFQNCALFYDKVPGSIRTQQDDFKGTRVISYYDEFRVKNSPNYFTIIQKEFVYHKGVHVNQLTCIIQANSRRLSNPVEQEVFFKIDQELVSLLMKPYQINSRQDINQETSTLKDKEDNAVTVVSGVNQEQVYQHVFEIDIPESVQLKLQNAKSISFQMYANKKPVTVEYSPLKILKLQKLFQ
jgi:hypothetical protein